MDCTDYIRNIYEYTHTYMCAITICVIRGNEFEGEGSSVWESLEEGKERNVIL